MTALTEVISRTGRGVLFPFQRSVGPLVDPNYYYYEYMAS